MGKREREIDAIRLYADGMDIPDISKTSKKEGWYVSENTLRDWKKKAGTEWDDARAAARKSQLADMEDVGSRLRRSREITAQISGNAKNQSEVGMILNQTLQTMVFDLLGQLSTTGIVDLDTMAATTDQLKGLSLTLARLETAASNNLRRETEIRKQALADAASAIGEEARAQGMDEAQAEFWMKKVLGVA